MLAVLAACCKFFFAWLSLPASDCCNTGAFSCSVVTDLLHHEENAPAPVRNAEPMFSTNSLTSSSMLSVVCGVSVVGVAVVDAAAGFSCWIPLVDSLTFSLSSSLVSMLDASALSFCSADARAVQLPQPLPEAEVVEVVVGGAELVTVECLAGNEVSALLVTADVEASDAAIAAGGAPSSMLAVLFTVAVGSLEPSEVLMTTEC